MSFSDMTTSSQPSLYEYYTPITSSSSSPPSTSPLSAVSSRARQNTTPKRPHHSKTPASTPFKKQKLNDEVKPAISKLVDDRITLPRSLLRRSLTGNNDRLSMIPSVMYSTAEYYSRPIDVHRVQTPSGFDTFPFAVECCNSTLRLGVTDEYLANSLIAVSDERGDIRLLETDVSCETGLTQEYLRMTCHDNAIFDLSWSCDDLLLVLCVVGINSDFRRRHQEIKLVRFSIS